MIAKNEKRGISWRDFMSKKMSTAIAAVLKHVGIEPLLQIISYDGEKYEHI